MKYLKQKLKEYEDLVFISVVILAIAAVFVVKYFQGKFTKVKQ